MSDHEPPSADEQPSSERQEPRASPKWELLLALLGGAVVLAVLAFLAYQALAVSDTGPQLSAAVSNVERVGDHFVAHVRVDNDGNQTARGVNVSGELSANGKTLQQASTTISYLPPTSFRKGALLFTKDPRQLKLTVRVAGYELP